MRKQRLPKGPETPAPSLHDETARPAQQRESADQKAQQRQSSIQRPILDRLEGYIRRLKQGDAVVLSLVTTVATLVATAAAVLVALLVFAFQAFLGWQQAGLQKSQFQAELIHRGMALGSTIERSEYVAALEEHGLLPPRARAQQMISSLADLPARSAIAYHITFDDTSATAFAHFFHIPTGHYRLGFDSPEADYQRPSASLCIHFYGPATTWMTLPVQQCAGHRVLVVAWAKSVGIVHHGTSRVRGVQQPADSLFWAGKFHLSWHPKGAPTWAISDSADFVSNSAPGFRLVGPGWQRVIAETPPLPQEIDGVNFFMGIQHNTGELWIKDLTIVIY